jgi:4-hydroxy-2-oxoheptanedioate aldolase
LKCLAYPLTDPCRFIILSCGSTDEQSASLDGAQKPVFKKLILITVCSRPGKSNRVRPGSGDTVEQAKDIVCNTVKEKLARNEVVASMTVRLVRGIEIAQIAKTAGFDMLYVDMEHSSLSFETTGQICLAALSAGIAPMVRVPSNTPENISRVLDGGALGVIAPHVGSAEEARAIVKAAKFPPLGERGAAGPLPQLQYHSFPAAQANAAINAATMVIVQFESAEAVDKADEIAGVEGVDMVLIGVNDMLASLGLAGQYEHPKVRDAYARTITACRRYGKHVGVGGLSARPKLAAEFIAMGARMVSTGTDIQFLLAAATEKASQVHEISV